MTFIRRAVGETDYERELVVGQGGDDPALVKTHVPTTARKGAARRSCSRGGRWLGVRIALVQALT